MKKKKKKKQSFLGDNPVLKIVFALLVLLVLVLSILVFVKEKNRDEDITPDLVIPVVGDNHSFAFNVNALALSQKDEYVFRVTNFKNSVRNEKDVYYTVTIMNKTKAMIEVFKGDSEENLMNQQEETILSGNALYREKNNQEDFVIKMTKTAPLDSKEFIQVMVEVNETN